MKVRILLLLIPEEGPLGFFNRPNETMNNKQTLQEVDIHLLFESPTNPRKTFDKADLAELAASIKQQGVLQNLVLRPVGEKYEIVAGARRFKASLLAGLDKVPAAVRNLNDDEVLDIQIIENLLRKDVHPLEEAEGYQNLINSNRKLTVPEIALKVCKSETYIYQRLKLNDLIDDCKTLFRKNVLTIGHSILLARLQADDQIIALEDISTGYMPDKLGELAEVESVASLDAFIKRNLMLDLNSAPFKKEDSELYPTAGSCVNCPKRTGFLETLFPDIPKKDTCTDPKCFNLKKDLFLEKKIQELTSKDETPPVRISSAYYGSPKGVLGQDKYKQVKKNECASVVVGLVCHGDDFGKKIFICKDKDCAQHFGSSMKGVKKISAEEEVKKKQKQEDQERIAFLIAFKVGANSKMSFNEFELQEITNELWDDADSDITDMLAIELKWVKPGEDVPYKIFNTKKPSKEIMFQIIKVLLLNKVCNFSWGDMGKNSAIMKVAAAYKIDPKSIEKQVTEERKAREAQLTPAENSKLGKGLKALLKK